MPPVPGKRKATVQGTCCGGSFGFCFMVRSQVKRAGNIKCFLSGYVAAQPMFSPHFRSNGCDVKTQDSLTQVQASSRETKSSKHLARSS